MDTRGVIDAVIRIVEARFGPRIDVLAAYPARVASQASDGTLDVVPDSPKVPPLTGVPIRYGVPGVSAKVAAGARVMIEFAGGDPRQPMATIWESAAVTEITITATKVKLGGDRPIARRGDPVTVMLSPATVATLAKPGASTSIPLTGAILDGASGLTGP